LFAHGIEFGCITRKIGALETSGAPVHCTLVESPVPRGSNPTMSKRSRSVWEKNSVPSCETVSAPAPPGPPGLNSSAPTRSLGLAAGIRDSCSVILLLSGRDQSSGTWIVAHCA
jgi:hypothetical protein